MKWFHHECAAKHDPKLQTLGATYGAEGLGIYWGLLEEIGQHSDTFHLKVLGISSEIDQKFSELLKTSRCNSKHSNGTNMPVERLPKINLKILARILFTTPRRLGVVLQTCVEIGLFDACKWSDFNVLYSISFEHRADDYTRRQQRKSDIVRTLSPPDTVSARTISEQSTDTHRTKAEKVPPEQTTEQKKEKNSREEKRPETILSALHGNINQNLSTGSEQPSDTNLYFLIDPSPEEFRTYAGKCIDTIQRWNEGRLNPFIWAPAEAELKKLFCGGERKHKLAMCYQAFNLQGDKVNYPELVLRAVLLMLKASEKHRILNPFGWLWSCLHGNGDGTTPWVQLLTPDEERKASTPGAIRSGTHNIRPP